MKTAVIYARVSTEEQSFQSQIDDLQKYAEYVNLEIVGIFGEKVSGFSAKAKRPEYDKMKEFVVSNSVELILCWELSRFGRINKRTLDEIDFFRNNNINIYFKKENIHTLTNDPTSKLILNFFSNIAEFERETIVSRSIRGKASSAERGKRSGFLIMPYGYKSNNGFITIDEDEAKYVKMMFEMAIQGYSLRAIARKLIQLQIKTRNTSLGIKKKIKKELPDGTYKMVSTDKDSVWKTNTIRKILTSTLYKGERNYKGGIVIKIPQIVTEEVWNKTQSTFENHIGCVTSTKYEYLFKGKVYCGKCFHLMGTRTENRYAHTPSYYFCQSRREPTIMCKCGQFDSKIFDELIYTQLFKDKNLLEKVYEETIKEFNLDEKVTQINYFKREILNQEARRQRVINSHLDGDISDKVKDQEKSVIRNNIVDFENNISRLEKEINSHQKKDISEILTEMTYETKFDMRRESVEKYVDKINVFNVESYDIDFTKLTYANFWEKGIKQLKNPHGNDKLIYVEVFAFGNPKPLKVALTNVSKQCYINEKLNYSEGKLSLV